MPRARGQEKPFFLRLPCSRAGGAGQQARKKAKRSLGTRIDEYAERHRALLWRLTWTGFGSLLGRIALTGAGHTHTGAGAIP
jgi:hypothetical protein